MNSLIILRTRGPLDGVDSPPGLPVLCLHRCRELPIATVNAIETSTTCAAEGLESYSAGRIILTDSPVRKEDATPNSDCFSG
jgi:hypothetical protein